MVYSDMPFMRFALGVIVAGLPLAIAGADRRWVNGYILLLLLGTVVYNWRSLERASIYFSQQLKQ